MVDFSLNKQPAQVKNQVNEILCGFLKPLQQKDLLAYNNKESEEKSIIFENSEEDIESPIKFGKK